MSDDLKKQLDTALARIAALESARTPAPKSPAGIDPRALVNDPIGTMSRAGVPLEHISRVLVAHALGDQAPHELRTLAQMGPTITATQELSSGLQAVRQRLEQIDSEMKKPALRQSFSAVANDKSKYPLLATAMVKNPALYQSRVDSQQGDAAALAESLEAELKATAAAIGYSPPASQESAAQSQGQSTQTKQAQTGSAPHGGTVDMTPPPIDGKQPGVFDPVKDHEALKARILAKYSASGGASQ